MAQGHRAGRAHGISDCDAKRDTRRKQRSGQPLNGVEVRSGATAREVEVQSLSFRYVPLSSTSPQAAHPVSLLLRHCVLHPQKVLLRPGLLRRGALPLPHCHGMSAHLLTKSHTAKGAGSMASPGAKIIKTPGKRGATRTGAHPRI